MNSALSKTLLSLVGLILILQNTNAEDTSESQANDEYAKFQEAEKEANDNLNQTMFELVGDITRLESVIEQTVTAELSAIIKAMSDQLKSIQKLAGDHKVDISQCTSDVEYAITSTSQAVNLVEECINVPKDKATNEIVRNLTTVLSQFMVLAANLSIEKMNCDIKQDPTQRKLCFDKLLVSIQTATSSVHSQTTKKMHEATKIYQSLNTQFLQCSTTQLDDTVSHLEELFTGLLDCANALIYTATTPTSTNAPPTTTTVAPPSANLSAPGSKQLLQTI